MIVHGMTLKIRAGEVLEFDHPHEHLQLGGQRWAPIPDAKQEEKK